MPSADQVPVNSTHSMMRWHKWVVLIAGATGSALRAVCPFQPSHHAGWPTRSRLCRKRDGFLVSLAPGHHGPGHAGDLVGRIGLVPKQHSSGGKDRLGGISKQGDRYLRSLFVAGALAVIRYAKIHGTKHRPWLTALLARRPPW